MATSATQILTAILDKPRDLDHVKRLVAPDATYVSLNYSDPDLKRVMPWAGTGHGPEGIVQTFVDVDRYWETLEFKSEALFGDDSNAAMFGRFTYRSRVLGKEVTSPFAVYVRVAEGMCVYMQFMEDTFATTESFRSGGSWQIRSNPNGEEISV